MHKQDLTHTPGPLVSTDRNRVPPCGQRRTSISLFFFGNIEGRRGAENNIDPLSLVHHSLQTCFSIITVHNKLFKNPVLVLRFSHFIHRIKHSTSKINPILAVIHSYTHHTLIKKKGSKSQSASGVGEGSAGHHLSAGLNGSDHIFTPTGCTSAWLIPARFVFWTSLYSFLCVRG